MLRFLLASAISYAMYAHLQEEFIRNSSDPRHKDLTMMRATMIISDDDNDNNNNDDAYMVG